MDFELKRAREKLEKEHKDRKDRARIKSEKELKAKKERIQQREAIEAVQRSERILAAQAQIKADEEAQESLLSGRGVMFSCILRAVPFQGVGDKIKLPPSSFTRLSDEGAFDKGPLHFQLSVVHQESISNMEVAKIQNSRTTHSGVLEFTSVEGSVGLPPHIWSSLFPMDAPNTFLIEVRYVWLPKGTYAKLQPDGIGFSDIPNHKAVLETSLRQHATLSRDNLITVTHGDLSFKLRVVELKPASSVSVLETDIEVDVVGPNSSLESKNQHSLRPLVFGKSEAATVDEGCYVYYKFRIDSDVWDVICSGDSDIEIKLESDGGDTDIFVSKHPLIFPSRHQHGWSCYDVGPKALILKSKDRNLGPSSYSIGVYGFKGTTRYEISVAIVRDKHCKVGKLAIEGSDTVECRNCKHYIPSGNVGLHEAYCRRHNVVCGHGSCGIVLRVSEVENHVHCDVCGDGFHKNEIEKHVRVFHEPLQCHCGIVLEREHMVKHQITDCRMRLISCQFCGDMVQAGSCAVDIDDRYRGLSEHESFCGSRTAPCDSCGRSVMLKKMDIHQKAVHQKS